MSRPTTRRLWRRGLAVALVAPLGACSVPREADVAATGPSVSASGSSPSATPSSLSPAPTALPSPTPSPPPPKPPVPAAVRGYALGAEPRGIGDPLAGIEGGHDVFGAQTVRSVGNGGTPVGLLFLFAVRPQYVDDPAVTSVVLPRVTAGISGSGVPVRMQTFGRQRVGVGSSAKNGTIVVWYAAGVLAVVVGADPSLVTGYARAYIAAS